MNLLGVNLAIGVSLLLYGILTFAQKPEEKSFSSQKRWINSHIAITHNRDLFKVMDASCFEIYGTPEELMRQMIANTAAALSNHAYPGPENEEKFKEYARYLRTIKY